MDELMSNPKRWSLTLLKKYFFFVIVGESRKEDSFYLCQLGCDFVARSGQTHTLAEHMVTYHSEEDLKLWCLSKKVLEMYLKFFSHAVGCFGDKAIKMIKDENYNLEDDPLMNLQKIDE